MTEEKFTIGNQELTAKELRTARIVSFAVLTLILITVWYMLDLVLLTFILAFVFYNIVEKSQRRYRQLLPFKVPDALILTLAYIIFVFLLILVSGEFIPRLIEWITVLTDQILNFDGGALLESIDPRVAIAIKNLDINSYVTSGGMFLAKHVTNISTTIAALALDLFLALILSYLLLLEKKKIVRFGQNMANSRASFVYKYFVIFGGNFCKTFGKVMKVQVIIALVNALLSMVMLAFIGFEGLLGWGVMIFTLGLVPVAGVIISLFPLCIMAFNIGGITKIIEILIMICILHAIESYILNPKLMSSKTQLPVCFVFIILLVGQHYLGVWGLLIGVPIFIFMMNLLQVDYEVDKEKSKEKSKGKEKEKKCI